MDRHAIANIIEDIENSFSYSSISRPTYTRVDSVTITRNRRGELRVTTKLTQQVVFTEGDSDRFTKQEIPK
jgi:hypothetical protein